MKKSWLFFILLLAGCTANPPKPEVVTNVEKIETIKIPVLVPCVTLREIPTIPGTNLNTSTDPEILVHLLRADIDDFKMYAIKADSLLRSCLY